MESLEKADKRVEEESNHIKELLNEKDAMKAELQELKTVNAQHSARLEGAKDLEDVLKAQLKELTGNIQASNDSELAAIKAQLETAKEKNHKQESEAKVPKLNENIANCNACILSICKMKSKSTYKRSKAMRINLTK